MGREYVRDAIKRNGCRNVAITKTNGDLMLYGRNGNARSNVPSGLDRAIDELNNDAEYIDDVVLSERGNWLVLYGNNGLRWCGIPSSMESKLREFNRNNEVILTAVFNDQGMWIVITTEHFATSSSQLTDWLKDGLNKFGMLWTACLTDDCAIAVFERGYKFLGDVPQDLRQSLNETSMNVYRLKVAGTAWFYADRDGNWAYNM